MLTYARQVRLLLRFVTSASAWRCAGLLLLLVGAELIGFAQTRDTASVFGTLTDAQAAVIPGAAVTLTNVATGLVRTAETNESGDFSFPLVPVGSYKLSAEKSGFKTYVKTGILTRANDNIKVNVSMELGEVQQQITVEAGIAQVETRSPTLGQVVESKRVVELPLNTRNPADLTLLSPGVVSASGGNTGDGGFESFLRPRGQKLFSVNGSRNNNLRFTLDGGEHLDPLMNNNLPFPFPEAVQEFSVQTSNMTPEMGASSSGVVNIVTKSGTNEVHGNAFWFLRNTELNATNFFSHQRDVLRQNQPGFTLGGPLRKNKLFLFGGFQKLAIRQTSGSGRAVTLPAAERSGDFSAFKGQLYDPLTGNPFPGNRIPASMLSPAAQKLLTLTPLPDPDGFTRYSVPNAFNNEQYVLKGDYTLNQKHLFVLRYFQDDQTQPFKGSQDNVFKTGRESRNDTKSGTLSHNYTAGPGLVIHSQVTATDSVYTGASDFNRTYQDFGVKVRPLSNDIRIILDSGVGIGTPNNTHYAKASYEYLHDWNLVMGNHSMAWGFNLTWRQYNEDTIYNSSGAFGFDGSATGKGDVLGYDRADFMLGRFSFFQQNNGELENRRQMLKGFYFNDSWRVSSRLHVNLGMRYEPYNFFTDTKDRIQTFELENYAKGIKSKKFLNAPAGLLYPGDDRPGGGKVPRSGSLPDYNNVAPNIGFAWDPAGNGKTSVRGGYALFFDAPALLSQNNGNNVSPFSYSVELNQGLLDDPYRGNENLNRFPVAQFLPDTPYQEPVYTIVVDRKFIMPSSHNWNLTVEREVLPGTILRVGYIGTKGTHLKGEYDQNAPIYNPNLTLAQNRNTIDERRPIRGYQSIDRTMHGLGSIYHALQVTADKRYAKGITASAAYTWSTTIDYLSLNQWGASSFVNPFHFSRDRGLSDQDRRHRFVFSGVWDMPGFGKSGPALARAILGNWRMSGIATMQAGRPFNIGSTGGVTAGAGGARVDLIGAGYPILDPGRSKGEKIAAYFDVKRFGNAPPNTYGTLGRNALIGPGFANVDASLVKVFGLPFLGESGKGELRCDFFNAFNTTHLGNPVTGRTNPNFGRILGTNGNPRLLQLGLKIAF